MQTCAKRLKKALFPGCFSTMLSSQPDFGMEPDRKKLTKGVECSENRCTSSNKNPKMRDWAKENSDYRSNFSRSPRLDRFCEEEIKKSGEIRPLQPRMPCDVRSGADYLRLFFCEFCSNSFAADETTTVIESPLQLKLYCEVKVLRFLPSSSYRRKSGGKLPKPGPKFSRQANISTDLT